MSAAVESWKATEALESWERTLANAERPAKAMLFTGQQPKCSDWHRLDPVRKNGKTSSTSSMAWVGATALPMMWCKP